MTRGSIAAALAVLALVGACSGGDEDDNDRPSPSAAASPSESPTIDPFAPNLGERSLAVGETRRGSDVQTTVHEVRYPYPPGEYRKPDDGNDFLGLRIEQCVREGVADAGESTYNGEFYAVTASGDEYGGEGSSWNDWPSPKFPELVGAVPGRCLKGWMSLQIPKGIEIEQILWRPAGQPLAEWNID